MNKLLLTIAVASLFANVFAANLRTNATVNYVKLYGEQKLVVNVSSTANPTPSDIYIVVGQGFKIKFPLSEYRASAMVKPSTFTPTSISQFCGPLYAPGTGASVISGETISIV
jgi:hypothetical protein